MRKVTTILGFLVLASGCLVGQSSGNNLSADGGGLCAAGPLGAPISDFSGMEACCQAQGGEAHCLDPANIEAGALTELNGRLDTCAGGGLCVPDGFLRTGGAEPPQTCSAFGGDGVCLSVCIPEIANNPNVGLLQQGDCAGGDELCVPCINPLDQTDTGACALRDLATCDTPGGTGGGPVAGLSCDNPQQILDASTFPSCAPDAHCIPEATVAGAGPELVARLAPCANVPGSLCVPDIAAESGGFFTLATCNSVAGAEGRCASLSIPEVAAQADLLPQGAAAGCGINEACAPCFSPIDGSDTGICGLACDPGAVQAPVVLSSCGDNGGKCVPNTSIPVEQQELVEQLDCQSENDSCVPNQILNAGPYSTCDGSSLFLGNYVGSCLNTDILNVPLSGLIPRENCDDLFGDGFRCVPCERNGEPTGAPGCPGT